MNSQSHWTRTLSWHFHNRMNCFSLSFLLTLFYLFVAHSPTQTLKISLSFFCALILAHFFSLSSSYSLSLFHPSHCVPLSPPPPPSWGLSGRNVSASHLLSSPLCSLSARQSTSLPLSLLFSVLLSLLFVSFCLFFGWYTNKENSMSAVMFCGLRRDVGANSVGECGRGKIIWLSVQQFCNLYSSLFIYRWHCCADRTIVPRNCLPFNNSMMHPVVWEFV